MTSDEKKKAYCMLLDGKSYQEVADEFGLTRQAIHKAFADKVRFKKRAVTHLEKQVYPYITNFLYREQMSRSIFAEKCGIAYNSMLDILRGNREPRKNEIDKMLKVLGTTYEEAFVEKRK